jgi:hypothetical protein
VFLESVFRHPFLNVDAVTHHFYDGDSLIFDVYSTKEVSRHITPKEKLKNSNFSFVNGSLPTLTNLDKYVKAKRDFAQQIKTGDD